MDDGQTFANEKDCEKTLVLFGFLDNVLYSQRDIENDCRYEGAESQKISKVTFYDIQEEPAYVESKTSGEKVAFEWDPVEKSVRIDSLEFTVDAPENKYGERNDLLEIHYNKMVGNQVT